MDVFSGQDRDRMETVMLSWTLDVMATIIKPTAACGLLQPAYLSNAIRPLLGVQRGEEEKRRHKETKGVGFFVSERKESN